MKTGFHLSALFVVVSLLVANCSSLGGQGDNQNGEQYSFQAIHRTLIKLMDVGLRDETLAISHAQAIAIIPEIEKWQASQFALGPDGARAVYAKIHGVLSPRQNKWRPIKPKAAENDKTLDQTYDDYKNELTPGQSLINKSDKNQAGQAPLVSGDYMRLYAELMDRLKSL